MCWVHFWNWSKDSNRKVFYMLLKVSHLFHLCLYPDPLFFSFFWSGFSFFTRRYIWCSNAFPMWVSLEKAARVEGSDAKCAFSDASERCQRRWIHQLPRQCRLQVSHVASYTSTCSQSEWTSQMLIFLLNVNVLIQIPLTVMIIFIPSRKHVRNQIENYSFSFLPILKRTGSLE